MKLFRDSEIISVEDMRAIDARSVELGVATQVLMEKAGAAVAAEIVQRFAPQPVYVACGPGNNGGDGYVAARLLAQAGFEVRVAAVDGAAPKGGDALGAALAWARPIEPLGAPPEAGIFVDAMFGAGLNRPLSGIAGQAALAFAARQARVIAVDAPSGLDGDGGAPKGPFVKAALTVTFVRKKPVHVLEPGKSACGEVVTADIGAPEQAVAERGVRLWENCPQLWRLPRPDAASHKHQRGRLAIWAGADSVSLTLGAARLAARAGQRAGAGWVSLYAPQALALLCVEPACLVVRPIAVGLDEALAHGCVVFGPGAGRTAQTATTARTLAERAQSLVLDADALSAQADDPAAFLGVLKPETVLTPHEGEFARLFPDLLSAPNKIARARLAAARAGCVVLLKGADTVVAAADGRAIVNTHASAYLATAGSGDVLAGMIGSLMAQGMPAFEAAAAAAWMQGEAALRFGPGLIADDLIDLIPGVARDVLAT